MGWENALPHCSCSTSRPLPSIQRLPGFSRYFDIVLFLVVVFNNVTSILFYFTYWPNETKQSIHFRHSWIFFNSFQVPQDPNSLRKNVYFCSGCNQYLLSTEFPLSSNTQSVSRCRECTKIENDSRVRQDFSHYRYMLQALRQAEENYADNSKIAFLLQVTFYFWF